MDHGSQWIRLILTFSYLLFAYCISCSELVYLYFCLEEYEKMVFRDGEENACHKGFKGFRCLLFQHAFAIVFQDFI